MQKVKTTNRFYQSFPSGIETLNVMSDKFYYFNKTSNGYIYDGMFWSFLDNRHFTNANYTDFPSEHYSFVYNRATKETFKLS